MSTVRRLLQAEEGASLVEYALLVMFIALACVTAVTALGLSVNGVFSNDVLLGALAGAG